MPRGEFVWLIERAEARDAETISGTSWKACAAIAEKAHPGCVLTIVEIADHQHFRLYAEAGQR